MDLFGQLTAEAEKIEKEYSALSQRARKARYNHDVETLKECIRIQREYTNRIA